MGEAILPAREKLNRATSRAFVVVFAIATVIAAGVTYLAVSDNNPSNAGQPGLLWLLIANLIIIAAVGGMLGQRVVTLLRENRETGGGARLRLRIILLFSLAAAIPTLLVAGFLAVTINRAVEGWFSRPVTQIVEGGTAAANETVKDYNLEAEAEVRDIITDFNTVNKSCQASVDALRKCLELRGRYRGLFRRIEGYDGAGKQLFELAAEDAAPAKLPPREFYDKLASGQPLWGKAELDGVIRVLFPAPGLPNVYVYVARSIPPRVFERLHQAQQSLDTFRAAQRHRNDLSIVLVLSYFEAAALMLLGTAWLGMFAATRIASPIGQLAGAARAVRDGDLSVRMERPAVKDEIDDLTDAFNQMTDRIARQTAALDRGRIDAEARSAFIEAVLSGVEAGVMRIDGDMKITIANASAQSMLGFTQRSGVVADLSEIAPDFVPAARRAIETGTSVETTLKRTGDQTTHLSVRVAPETEGPDMLVHGAVITFHDTTRLVMGQRQAAWRDVARRIAHEIRNPLTPIQLSAERLKRRFSQQITSDRETFERCTETITRQVADIGRMVEEFSGFARMPKPTFGEFNMVDLIQSVAFSQRMATPAITVTVNAPTPRIIMQGDERMLAQAITNVVKNGAEALERGVESGLIKAGALSIDIADEGDEVQLTIRDNGPGFPAQDRDRLLEPYVTTRKNGVGLGLAIVTRIVEDHGGRIWLGDNDLAPSGARVDIRIPVEPTTSDELVAYAGEGVA